MNNSFGMTRRFLWVSLMFLVFGLSACSSLKGTDAASGQFDPDHIPNAIPQAGLYSQYGNPKSYFVHGHRYYVLKNAKGYDKTGLASWYGTKFHGQHTSSRESYNMYSMTAASPVLPIPSYVKVTNLQNGRTAIVKVNDRGPFCANRLIDLSYAAAVKLGYASQGTAKVHITTIDATSPSPSLLFAQNNVISPVASTKIQTHSLTQIAQQPVQLAANDLQASSLYVQVGSFHNRKSAETTRQKITTLTHQLDHTQVAIKESTTGQSHLYRVHIGPLKNTNESSEMTQLLARNGFEKTIIVTG